MQLAWISAILVRDLEGVKRELAAYPDEASVWSTPPGIANSSGTLALHLAGNIRHFIGGVLGGSGYVRDREREFAARNVSRAELTADLDAAIAAVRATFDGSRAIDFGAPYPEKVGGKFHVVTGDWLLNLVAHLTFHLGQMGYHRRLTTGSATSAGPIPLDGLATIRAG